MTKTVSISEAQTHLAGLLASARANGDEIIIEENGEALAKLTPIEKPQVQKPRVAGLGKGTMWMSEDFDEEIYLWEKTSDEDFLNFEKKIAGEK